MIVEKIVSGGQTGVDRAALDVALDLKIPCGGWCPQGRRAEDGPLDERYPLSEMSSPDYSRRTERNVQESDGTLILAAKPVSGGTALTWRLADKHAKPCLIVDPENNEGIEEVADWLTEAKIRVLNIAGPRESHQPGIHDRARRFLEKLVRDRHL